MPSKVFYVREAVGLYFESTFTGSYVLRPIQLDRGVFVQSTRAARLLLKTEEKLVKMASPSDPE